MKMKHMIALADKQMLKSALPCPFCAKTDLSANGKWLHEHAKEITVIHCDSCDAEAPFNSWQHRGML